MHVHSGLVFERSHSSEVSNDPKNVEETWVNGFLLEPFMTCNNFCHSLWSSFQLGLLSISDVDGDGEGMKPFYLVKKIIKSLEAQ